MRAWCLAVVLLASCGSDSVPAAPSDGDNATIVGPGTRSVPGTGSGGTGGDGGEGGSGGRSLGACANEADIEALDASIGAREIARECLILSFVACAGAATLDLYEGCVSDCVTNEIEGLSRSCGRCFGRASRCERENACDIACRLNVCSQGCTTCSADAGCLEELEQCTGLNDASCSGTGL